MDQWQVRAGTDCRGVVHRNFLSLEAQNSFKSVSIRQAVSGFKPGMVLLLSATISVEKVMRGPKSWNRARLLLVQNDGKRDRWDFPHHVGKPFEGSMNWKRFSAVFTISPVTEKLSVVAQMSQCRGRFELKDIHLVPVIDSAGYIWARRVVLFLWAVFAIVFVSALFVRTRKSTFIKAVLVLVSAGIIFGTTMPAGIKKEMVKDVKVGAKIATQVIVDADKKEIPWQPEKVGHFCLFALLGFILIRVLEQDSGYTALVYMLMVAAGTEFAQIYIDGRSGSLGDVFIDASGGCLGMMSAVLYRKLKNKKGKGRWK